MLLFKTCIATGPCALSQRVGWIAQSVEQRTENPCVGGSIPSPATTSKVKAMKSRSEIVLEGRRVAVSNLDKVFYPATGFTKGQVIEYYVGIAPVLLPHLTNR